MAKSIIVILDFLGNIQIKANITLHKSFNQVDYNRYMSYLRVACQTMDP